MGERVLDEVVHLPVRPEVPHGEKLTGSLLGLALRLLLQVVFISHHLHLQVRKEIHTFHRFYRRNSELSPVRVPEEEEEDTEVKEKNAI